MSEHFSNAPNIQTKIAFFEDSFNNKNLIIIIFIPCFNPLNPELNSICYLLALLGDHHFLHVSRIRVKL